MFRFREAGHAVMDLRMLYSRGDAHQGIDCLHMCQPGPLDSTVPSVFYNLLQHELRQKASPVKHIAV